MDFLPVNMDEARARGWEQLDFVIVTADAYIDHPSFGTAIISRVLESKGFKVGIIAQPNWKTTEDFMKFGKPRLSFLVNGGNIDSMVNHYSVAKKPRARDLYSPGGEMGHRPDRATIVYCQKIREAYGQVPIMIGGIEASLRRFAHYDYWDDKIRRSILFDSRASILMYGMGEKQIVRIADKLRDGVPVNEITDIPGTCYISSEYDEQNSVLIPSYEECVESKSKYAVSCRLQYYEQNPYIGKTLVQKHGDKYLIQNPPMPPLETDELDEVYALPYMKNYHPMYEKLGKIPAIEEIKFSITSNRGCFGGCNFCALAFHQGRIVQTRSHESILKEAVEYTKESDFKGYIHDVGGPTADFRQPACEKQLKKGVCTNRQCLFPKPCKNLNADHEDYLELLEKLRKIPNVKKVFIRSGIRFDYVEADKDSRFLEELAKYHVSGQLRVAPEHVSDRVLSYMGKPEHQVYQKFLADFEKANKKTGKKQYVVPYFMSSHPGCTLKDAVKLAEYVRDMGFMPEQVQDFYPTPSTMSTCMYYTGIDPRTKKEVYIPTNPHEKAMQRALIQYKNPQNRELVKEALIKAGRTDLIGWEHKCLIKEGKKTVQAEKDFKKSTVQRKKKTIRNVHKRKGK